jgi:hypothetical protein
MIWLLFTIGSFITGTLQVVRAAVVTVSSLFALLAAIRAYRAALNQS